MSKSTIMRIISGSLKNRVVPRLDSKRDRPTTAYIREVVFSIIGPNLIQGASFLDLFCGSGIVGLEAFSRGAASATFVDIESKHISRLALLARNWEIQDKVIPVCSDVAKWLKSIYQQVKPKHRFDIVYADPPYFSGKPERLQEALESLFHPILQSQDAFAEQSLMFLELSREAVRMAPEKPQSGTKRNIVSSMALGVSEAYNFQFDSPWPEIYRNLRIPLDFPLLDWRLTGTTAILIMGIKTCAPVREIF